MERYYWARAEGLEGSLEWSFERGILAGRYGYRLRWL